VEEVGLGEGSRASTNWVLKSSCCKLFKELTLLLPNLHSLYNAQRPGVRVLDAIKELGRLVLGGVEKNQTLE
jgi:hypothetical protein